MSTATADDSMRAIALRRVFDVVLGETTELPPCIRRATNVECFQLIAHFMPSRYQRLAGYIKFTDESKPREWVCMDEPCWRWAEEQADRLCPYTELPDAFYRYVDEQGEREYKMFLDGTLPLEEETEMDALWRYVLPSARTQRYLPWSRVNGVLEMLRQRGEIP